MNWQRLRSYTPVWIGLVAVVLLSVLQPTIGIRDVDAYAYLVGAYSLRAGHGYISITNDTLNHWPPGYALLLSAAPNEIAASQWLNYLAFGAALALVFWITRRSGWSGLAACGLCVGLGAGFFRDIATNSKADILSYALFLAGLGLFTGKTARERVWGLTLWALVMPLKYIAFAFVPAGLVIDFWLQSDTARLNNRQRIFLVLISGVLVGTLLLFNWLSLGMLVASSHSGMSLASIVQAAVEFVTSFFRVFVSYWYGSLREPLALGAFGILFIAALVAFATLRPGKQEHTFRLVGIAVLACSAGLLLIRNFDGTFRLLGYGPLAFLLGLVPLKRWNWVWSLYGVVALGVATLNVLTTNSLGSNDPRYIQLAQRLQAQGIPQEMVWTNSFRILDVHVHAPSRQVRATPTRGDYYLLVRLPSYDAIATTVIPLPEPDSAWCLMYDIGEAALFRYC